MSKEQSVKPVVNHLQVIEKNTESFLKRMHVCNNSFVIISPYYQNAFPIDESFLPEGRENLASPDYEGLLSGEITWSHTFYGETEDLEGHKEETTNWLTFHLKQNGRKGPFIKNPYTYDKGKDIFTIKNGEKECGVVAVLASEDITDLSMRLIRKHFFNIIGGKCELIWIENHDFIMRNSEMNAVINNQSEVYALPTKSNYVLVAPNYEKLAKTPKKLGTRKQN